VVNPEINDKNSILLDHFATKFNLESILSMKYEPTFKNNFILFGDL